jgi:NAD(P)-dependent dehydrogenase (short-subunit alcohol dehydrogenase family)
MEKKIALVTGANRGIGFEVARELAQKGIAVILTARNAQKGSVAADRLKAEGLDVHFHELDVTDDGSVRELAQFMEKRFGRLDVLVNNAGVLLDSSHREEGASAFGAQIETIRASIETNTLGAFRLCQALIPLMRKNGSGRVVNVSTGMAQLSEMDGGYPGYRISKTALNAVTRIFSAETRGNDILVNSVCPGWVRTEMGGEGAERTPAQGAAGVVWAATLPPGGPTGGFFRDGERIDW